jgi:hypothetical protein
MAGIFINDRRDDAPGLPGLRSVVLRQDFPMTIFPLTAK